MSKIMERVEIKDCGYMIDGKPSPCHLWTGPDSGEGRGGGYGRMKLDGGTVSVHITAWVCEHGPIPPRKQLDHACEQRRCANEAHLELVTHLQNQRRRDKRRAARLSLQA